MCRRAYRSGGGSWDWTPLPLFRGYDSVTDFLTSLSAGLLAALSFRSPRWPSLRKKHLETEPACVACGSRKNLNVHHILPVHHFPTKELEPTNLVTLCENSGRNCHFTFGHLGNWNSWNEDVRADAVAYREKVRSRPTA